MSSVSSTTSSTTSTTATPSSADQWVAAYMMVEQQPLDTLEAKKDELDVKAGVFNDMESKMTDLRDAAEALFNSSDEDFVAHSVSTSDDEFATGSADAEAANGTYVIENIVLAKADRKQSTQMDRSWTAGTGGTISVNGKDITIAADASLRDVMLAINGADYDTDKGVIATIVNDTATTSRLILQAEHTGTDYAVNISDTSGSLVSGFGLTTTQTARNASFTVNGTAVVSSSNAADNVVTGLTINLQKEGGPVTLTVNSDVGSMKSKIQSFLTKLNDLNIFISEKSASIKTGTNTYARGALSGYSMYGSLRSELSMDLQGYLTGLSSGAPSRLSQIGITMNSEGDFTISDTKALETALSGNAGGVADLLGGSSGVVKKLYDRLTPYVKNIGNSTGRSYVQADKDGVTGEESSIDKQIKTMNERLAQREKYYRDQYTRLQQAYLQAQQLQERMNALFG